jgi:Kef-type K+ transport system membrane component KefB
MILLFMDLVRLLILIGLGYLCGDLVARVKLPKVLGYLFVGMIIGPFALGFIQGPVPESSLITLLIAIGLGYVGFSIGSGIHISDLKKSGSKMLVINMFTSYTPFILVTLSMFFLLNFDLITSLVIGSIALATAPIVALSIVKEYKTDGPVTRTLMPIVAIDDALALITFGLIIGFADSYYSGMQASLIEPFVDLFLSIGVGLTAGFISYSILRRINKRRPLVLITALLLLLTMIVTQLLHAEMLIAGIAFGLIVFNLLESSQQKQFTEANNPLIQLSILVFMVLIGTTLDLKAVLSLTTILGALVYVVARATGKIGGAFWGGKLAGAEPIVQRYLGLALLAAAGITLTFVAIASAVLPDDLAIRMATIVAAAALINEIIAVFATKWALVKAGEIGKADS